MLPQRLSRRTKRNGRSTLNDTAVALRRRTRQLPTAVAALASVPAKSTLMIALCVTKSTYKFPAAVLMPPSCAFTLKTLSMPNDCRCAFRSTLFSRSNLGSVTSTVFKVMLLIAMFSDANVRPISTPDKPLILSGRIMYIATSLFTYGSSRIWKLEPEPCLNVGGRQDIFIIHASTVWSLDTWNGPFDASSKGLRHLSLKVMVLTSTRAVDGASRSSRLVIVGFVLAATQSLMVFVASTLSFRMSRFWAADRYFVLVSVR